MTPDPLAAAFHAQGMAQRKQRYFEFIRSHRLDWFTPEGTYRPETENDRRITFWTFPAFVSSGDPEVKEWALSFYAADPAWNEFNIFNSSSIAINLVRERRHLTPELIRRSEEHLARFSYADGGRKPCAAANDFVFQGYNDNMPAMATRQLILAGDILDKPQFTDAGLFRLEALCAHFQRRGLLSEHTSGTYTPVTLTALMDTAECTANTAAREMALACVQRILLDVFAHFHQTTGAIGGVQSRAYTIDLTGSLSCLNTLFWYMVGHPLLIDPVDALSAPFDGPIHHGGCKAFTGSAHAEIFSPSYHLLHPEIVDYARSLHADEHEVRGTSDYGPCGTIVSTQAMSGTTTAFHRKLWCLASHTSGASWSTQKTCLQGTIATTATPVSWKDRLNFWEYLTAEEDYGQLVPNHLGQPSEIDHVNNIGDFRTLQKKGSAMSMGLISPSQDGKEFSQLRYGMLFCTNLKMPDQVYEEEEELSAWEGTARQNSWQFLRFDQVYVGLRMTGAFSQDGTTPGSIVLPQRLVRNRYLRLELPVVQNTPVRATSAFRWKTHFGCVIEVSDQSECGSFEEFRRQCRQSSWEYFLTFSRNARYCGRNGEFQICDSTSDGTVKMMAMDGAIPRQPELLEATGLDPRLVQLFPDGKRIRIRRLLYNGDFPGTPFYPVEGLVLSTK